MPASMNSSRSNDYSKASSSLNSGSSILLSCLGNLWQPTSIPRAMLISLSRSSSSTSKISLSFYLLRSATSLSDLRFARDVILRFNRSASIWAYSASRCLFNFWSC